MVCVLLGITYSPVSDEKNNVTNAVCRVYCGEMSPPKGHLLGDLPSPLDNCQF